MQKASTSKDPVSVLQGYNQQQQPLTEEESRGRQRSETRTSPWTRTLQETSQSAPSGRASLAGGSLVASLSTRAHVASQTFCMASETHAQMAVLGFS